MYRGCHLLWCMTINRTEGKETLHHSTTLLKIPRVPQNGHRPPPTPPHKGPSMVSSPLTLRKSEASAWVVGKETV